MSRYVDITPLKRRAYESNYQRVKHPGYVPTIVECSPDLDKYLTKRKYLVPKEITVAMFLAVLRKHAKFPPHKAVFIFTGKTMPMSTSFMGDVYKNWLYNLQSTGIDDDIYLYCYLASENCFGCADLKGFVTE